MNETHIFRRVNAILGESLVWDASARSIRWCDITAGTLNTSGIDDASDGSDDAVIALPAPLASFHPAENGLVASLGDRVVVTDAQGAIVRELAAINHAHPGMRLNEGKVDPSGRWITGSMDLTRDAADGAFYSVTDQGARVLYGGVGVANGLEWSLDGTQIYFTDTSVGSVYRGRYSAEGEISDVSRFHHGVPHDGLAIDLDGCLWGAEYGRGRVVRYSPDGTELMCLELPAPNLTSVAFGGDSMSTLFVASARENLTEQQLVEHPLSGSVFAIDTSVQGRLAAVYGLGRS